MVIFSGRRPDEDAGGLTGQTGWLGERPGQHGSAYRRYTSAVDICDHRRQFRSDPRLREAVMWSVAVQVLIGLAILTVLFGRGILSVVVVLAAGAGPIRNAVVGRRFKGVQAAARAQREQADREGPGRAQGSPWPYHPGEWP